MVQIPVPLLTDCLLGGQPLHVKVGEKARPKLSRGRQSAQCLEHRAPWTRRSHFCHLTGLQAQTEFPAELTGHVFLASCPL